MNTDIKIGVKIKYGRTFPLGVGTYASERIDVEIELEKGQTISEEMINAKKFVEEFHRTQHHHLYQETTPILHNQQIFTATAPIEIKQQEEKISPEQGRQHTKNEMVQCTTLAELKNWELIANLHPETKEIYDQMHSIITKENTHN